MAKNADTVAKAVLDLELFLAHYLELGSWGANRTIEQIIYFLDLREVIAAAA
ncbi:MAG: hypothetical protein JWR80_4823 [Bradyrhizobium sp.]|nr:hypothetical protein [Bradyrhizobium sp.]